MSDPVPEGVAFDNKPADKDTPVPSGITFDSEPAQQDTSVEGGHSAGFSSPEEQSLFLSASKKLDATSKRHMESGKSWWTSFLTKPTKEEELTPEEQKAYDAVVKRNNGSIAFNPAMMGTYKGEANTAIDVANLGIKAANQFVSPTLSDVVEGKHSHFSEINKPDALKPQGAAENIGYGGETLMEFMMGDEALKGLNLSEKLAHIAQTMKIFEKAPRLMAALKMGASAGKAIETLGPEEQALVRKFPLLTKLVGAGMDALRAGTVQGLQTFAHTGGDVGQSLADAATMTATSGVVGGTLGTIGHALGKAGDIASKVGDLSRAAEEASSKEEVTGRLAKNIEAAKDQLHHKYETGINNLKDRLKDNEIDYEGSPLHEAALELSNKGAKDSKPLDAAFSKDRPGSKKVNNMLDMLTNPNGEEEAGAVNPQSPEGAGNDEANPQTKDGFTMPKGQGGIPTENLPEGVDYKYVPAQTLPTEDGFIRQPPKFVISDKLMKAISDFTNLKSGFGGLSVSREHLRNLATFIDGNAKYGATPHPILGAESAGLAAALRHAADTGGKGGAIYLVEGMDKAAYGEEVFHYNQRSLAPFGLVYNHLSDGALQRLLVDHPDGPGLFNWLELHAPGFSSYAKSQGMGNAVVEIGAKLVAGHPLFVNQIPEAMQARWLTSYIDELEMEHGPEKVADVFNTMYDRAKEIYKQYETSIGRKPGAGKSGFSEIGGSVSKGESGSGIEGKGSSGSAKKTASAETGVTEPEPTKPKVIAPKPKPPKPLKPAKAAAPKPEVEPEPVKPPEKPPEDKPPIKLNIDELIERRQLLGQRLRKLGTVTSEDRADREVYSRLIKGIDDTIGELANKSGDPSAVSDYELLRQNYRDKIGLFDDPIINKIRDGKVDDAAKDFVGRVKVDSSMPSGGKVRYNTDILKQVIGPDGVKAFGRDVFGSLLKDSMENGQFNPSKFTKTWSRIADDTKDDLFDVHAAENGLKQLAQDAKSAANLQHLTRVGVLSGGGSMLGALSGGLLGHMGIGSLIGLTVAEGAGGIAVGRQLLDYVATHPATWRMYEAIGKAANSPVASTAADIAKAGIGKGAVALRHALGGASALSQ